MRVKDLDKLVGAVQGALTPDLLSPKYRGGEHCLAGHCAVATEALYFLLGGQKSGFKPMNVQHEGGSHWYLQHKHSGAIVDATADQFKTPVPYGQGRGRGFPTPRQGNDVPPPSKRAQVVIERVKTGSHDIKKAEAEQKYPKAVSSLAIFNSSGYLLMGIRNDSGKWTLPGGKADPGEGPEKCARRELWEEAGLKISRLEFLGVGWGGKSSNIRVYCYRGESDDKPTAENDPDKECDEWVWVDVRTGLPPDVASNLHNNNCDITLQHLGLQEGTPAMGAELSKSWKHAFVGAAAAAGMMAGPAHAANHVASDKPEMKWTPQGMHEDLLPIAQLESSMGKHVHHKAHSKGEMHTAVGAVGLKPVTALEQYKGTKYLQQVWPNLHDPAKFLHEFKTNSAFYNAVATAHWGHIKKVVGDPARAAYAWRWGIGALHRDPPEVIRHDPYALAYQKLLTKQRGWGHTLQNPLAMAKSEDWLVKAQARKMFRSKDGISIPAVDHPQRPSYDSQFQAQVQNTFGAGVGKTLKPMKLPTASINGNSGNMPVNKDRLALYTNMARAGDRLPPIVVRRNKGNIFDLIDGSHRFAAAKVAGLPHLDAYEVTDEAPIAARAAATLPNHLKLYNLAADPHGHMQPQMRQTKYGMVYEPTDFKSVEKKLLSQGYHGYHGHQRDMNSFQVFPKYAKLAGMPTVNDFKG